MLEEFCLIWSTVATSFVPLAYRDSYQAPTIFVFEEQSLATIEAQLVEISLSKLLEVAQLLLQPSVQHHFIALDPQRNASRKQST